jgi:septal ring factor EnvC (AmiA/AmiB activator)
MWSAAGVFTLSLAGQSAARLVGVKVMTAFANGMPVIVLALIALLVHLRQLDRADKTEAAKESALATELAVLRAELETAQEAIATAQAERAADAEPLREALAAAQRQAEEDAQKRAILERKIAAQKPSRGRANQPRAKSANARATQAHEKDVDARTKALEILAAEPDISGAKLAERVGMSKRWGQLHKPELVAMAADLEGSQS